MKFDLKKSKLLFEVRYRNRNHDDIYTYEMLYRREDGKYFIHFEGSKYSEYAVKIGYCNFVARSGNYFIDDVSIELWKSSALSKQIKYPEDYLVIDWEREEEESILKDFEENDNKLIFIENLTEAELPF